MRVLMIVVVGLGSSTATPGLREQCRSENEVAGESEQCGGLGWNVSCANGTTCERQNEGWASCESTSGVLNPVAEWQQCDHEDSGNACADNLICVDDNDYHGLCVKEKAELWGQCGGAGWTTDCEDGSVCEVKTATYSQCVSDASKAGDPSVGDAETLAAVTAGLQGTVGITMSFKSIDVSSLVRPLAQLQEIAEQIKNFPCSVRTIVFPDTICEGSDKSSNST
ncbi:RxLR-like protein [Phytophthora cinnamomi]|uniref:RxLR-like protein n=1 Tax=Phytophthora cinnamomi TaxID=4785 RepID=UPI00355AC769|nr:RxLR-like protein [Phytophthora cinnamomi]